jgi:hypothetical protein
MKLSSIRVYAPIPLLIVGFEGFTPQLFVACPFASQGA